MVSMSRTTKVLIALALGLSLVVTFAALLGEPAYADSITVTKTTDSGDESTAGTLSRAISEANGSPGSTIVFDLPDDADTITVTGALPALTGGDTTISGSTGYTPAIQLIADGPMATQSFAALRIRSANNTVRGLAIGGFGGFGITISGTQATSNTIAGCHIGTNLQGTEPITIGTAITNGDGILIYHNAGETHIYSNTISGNRRHGIHIIGGGNNEIRWNHIGVDAAGTGSIATVDVPLGSAKGNGKDGIQIEDSDENVIQDNIVSANYRTGIFLYDGDANEVYGNKIGTGATGTEQLSNGFKWVGLTGGTQDTGDGGIYIGGDSGSRDNVIGGDGELANQIAYNVIGLRLSGAGTQGNRVLGNTIVSNERYGITSRSTHSNTTDLTPSDGDNLIAGNIISGTSFSLPDEDYGTGILNFGASPLISGNQVYNNQLFGIGNFPDFGTDQTPDGTGDDTLAMPTIVNNTIDGNEQEGIFSRDTAPLNRYTLHDKNAIGDNHSAPDVAQRWIGAVEVYTGTTRITSGLAVTVTSQGQSVSGDVYDDGAWGPSGFDYQTPFTETVDGTTWFQITEFEVSAAGEFVSYTHLVQVGGDYAGAATFSFDGISATHPVSPDHGLPAHVRTGITSRITQTLDRYQIAQVTVFNPNEDADGDGINNAIEGADDADGDGVPNFRDDDADGDGIDDATEGAEDVDGDDVPNFLDTDSDGDGVDDSDEYDVDGDGEADDSDDDGIPDYRESNTNDADGDGTPDYLDEDADGDGISDDEEYDGCGESPCDADGDGIPDYLESNIRDTDGDGTPDYLDEDADGDDLSDSREGPYADEDDDGVPDYLENNHAPDESPPPDYSTDPDGDEETPRDDLDSDDDSILDATEFYPQCEEGAELRDTDSDGVPNCADWDADGDGIPNFLDTDSDNDGVPDEDEGAEDANNNGVPDYLDPPYHIYLPLVVRAGS
jgi:parallel beta-helix repeat protein